MQVKEIGEFPLIELLTKDLVYGAEVEVGPGDDAAVVRFPGANDTRLLLTSDCMVEGVHFFPGANALDVGYKLLSSNVSDIAAMGGRPKFALVTLIVPPTTSVCWLQELYKGLRLCAASHSVSIVGGDVSRGQQLAVNISLTGEVNAKSVMLRGGAKPEDLVIITGPLGAATAGLKLLSRATELGGQLNQQALQKHLRPEPRVREGMLLAEYGCKCANDISDGLASEAWEIAKASGVSIILNSSDIPIAPPAQCLAQVTGEDPLQIALSSGEEYELLACLPEEVWLRVRKQLPAATVIGKVVAGDGVYVHTERGQEKVGHGYSHFSSP